MGLKDLFSGGGRGGKGRVDKFVKVITNPYTQSADRYHAMQQLLDDGSLEAWVGLMKRFTVVSTKSIEDEEEKGWAYRELAAKGEKVLPALKQFCIESDNVAWALRILEDVANGPQEWDIIDAMLEKHPPEYARDSKTKLQLLTHLAEIDDDRVVGILLRYLDDPDESVRYYCVEQLIDIGDETAKPNLVARLAHKDEDSVRLRGRILDGFASLGWDLSAHQEAVLANLGNEHAMSKGKIVRR
ncbi:MAG: HEAT repeat domain-containing protein [Deltaproteobacteria bacterium]|nr:HEAT repeat domain-containing protein [Deltaproteobacteria bacterium]MBK8717014.1 HEAT repeat domain-containing protein [Deltaproteobacteria bacterium]MBP7292544.1 HEAT repeat domain-containing protein [Nannocystaceae bacterium]